MTISRYVWNSLREKKRIDGGHQVHMEQLGERDGIDDCQHVLVKQLQKNKGNRLQPVCTCRTAAGKGRE